MSVGKITILGIVFWLSLLLLKYGLLQNLGLDSTWEIWVYYILIIIFARVISRRVGVINFLEAIFVSLVWMLIILLLDTFIAKKLLDPQIFTLKHYWFSFLALFVGVFFLHKKRHIQIRKEQAAAHHH